jgi:rhomboid-like protein
MGSVRPVLTLVFTLDLHASTGYYFMAPAVLSMLGNTAFLALYLGGGMFSSVTSLLYHNKNHPGSQGASGRCLS